MNLSNNISVNLKKTLSLEGVSWSTPAYSIMDEKFGILIAADTSGAISAYDIENEKLIWRRYFNARISASPMLVDVNYDGVEEVIIGTENGDLLCLDLNYGETIWCSVCGKAIRSTAAFADIDQDNNIKIFITGFGTHMYCLEGATGEKIWKKYLPKHEFFRGSKLGAVSSPLIADVDLDGELEVVVGIRSRRLYCLNAKNGEIKWFAPLDYDPDSSPSFAVINRKPMVFFGGGEHTSGQGDNSIIALHGNDGSIAWKTSVHGGLDSCPIISDIDNDDNLEIVICSLADASCYALKAESGEIVWQYKFGPTNNCEHDDNNICRKKGENYLTQRAICRSYTTPLILNSEFNSQKVIIVGSNNGKFVILSGASGAELFGYQSTGLIRGSPIFIPQKQNNQGYIVIVSGDKIYLFAIQEYTAEWRMFKGRGDHLGLVTDDLKYTCQINLHKQNFTYIRLFWHWIIIDLFRYLIFQLDYKLLRRIGLKILNYYY